MAMNVVIHIETKQHLGSNHLEVHSHRQHSSEAAGVGFAGEEFHQNSEPTTGVKTSANRKRAS